MTEEGKRKKGKVRSDADLIAMGTKGKVFLVVRKAFGLVEAKKAFAGTVRDGKKYPSGPIYSKGKKDGSYWSMPEDGAEFKAIKKAANGALKDVQKAEVTASVKNLIDVFSTTGGGGRGSSALNMTSLDGLNLG
jgi:hypothetical protein